VSGTAGGTGRRVVVTGGAGFIGSHLCERLLEDGDAVVCVDDFSTGRPGNVEGLLGRPGFEVIRADVSAGLEVEGEVHVVAHLGCPASPPHYLARPLETLQVCSEGTRHALELAHAHGARFLLASTSEVYGDPEEHPQEERYWGHVNPVGPRSVYDEGKRYAEALSMAWRRTHGTDVGVIRIFNTYGPRLRPDDGRVVSNFLVQAMRGDPLTVYGDGSQTRSLCYVDDLVDGIVRMLDCGHSGPVNLGNPDEYTVLELARLIIEFTGSSSPIEHLPLPEDDPTRRRPDITLATQLLGWKPTTPLEEGLRRTATALAAQAG
jgi:dTDP-glucose 4,6-dehydratase